MIFKLAEKLSKKYAADEQDADHYGVDPETGTGIVPKFENGDIVSYRGKKAVYLTQAYWSRPGTALIQFLDKKIPTTKEIYSGGLDYAPESDLVLVQKKAPKPDVVTEDLPKVANKR